MGYNVNPFLERRSERTTSDQEFALVFSPKILEKLSDDVLQSGVHVFSSAPGGGKTTILRAFTPSVLRSFWHARGINELKESFPLFVAKGVLDETDGPKLLGVLISCASGYADLPPSSVAIDEGPFRALLDCRVVLRTLRSLAAYIGSETDETLKSITLEYGEEADDLKNIPKLTSAHSLVIWAERQEKQIYSDLDAFAGRVGSSLPAAPQFESLLWLQSVRFLRYGTYVASNRVVMIDDLHRLRSKQRERLIDEVTVQRPSLPVWLAMRTVALQKSFLSQGARVERDIRHYSLEELWGGSKGIHKFLPFAQNVLDRRMNQQNSVAGNFSQHLREQQEPDEIRSYIVPGVTAFRSSIKPHERNERYREWIDRANRKSAEPSIETLLELYITRILMARDASKQQLSFDLALPAEEIDEKDTSSLRAAAEIQLHDELDCPYYYGLERLCVMASFNVEELLSLSAALYDGIVAKQILRTSNPELSPAEQEKILCEQAAKRLEFVPKQHTEGARAQRLLNAIGNYCRSRTLLPNAPYAPGVTGIRLPQSELKRLLDDQNTLGEQGKILKRVLSECAAENLLVLRQSSASAARQSGSIFYLNRTLCAHFGLPLQMGGWQDITCLDLIDWMVNGWAPKKRLAI